MLRDVIPQVKPNMGRASQLYFVNTTAAIAVTSNPTERYELKDFVFFTSFIIATLVTPRASNTTTKLARRWSEARHERNGSGRVQRLVMLIVDRPLNHMKNLCRK
jgi:hypothetical protein